MQIPLITVQDNILTLLRPYGRELNLKINDIIRADVLNVMSSGDVSLRINQNNGDSIIIVARADVPLTKGTSVFFKVTASDAEIKLQLMGTASEGNRTGANPSVEALPQKVLRMLSELAGSRLRAEDIRLMDEVFKSLPDRIKTLFPEFRALERIMPEIEKLNSGILKESVEESGVLFETKLKTAVRDQAEGRGQEKLDRLLASGDHKLDLLKLKAALGEARVIEALRRAGVKPSEIQANVDKVIKNLEFFQLASQVNDTIYTFLPLAWQDLREGELSFKKGSSDTEESYTCEINLDLEPVGKLSVSVTLHEGSYYVTFYAEDQKLKDLINESKGLLGRHFSDAGLSLMIINITQRQEIRFGAKKGQGLNIRV
jgi:hypothetical protein